MLRGPRAGARALLLVLVLGGCDWRDFDAVLEKAPVLSMGAPDGFGSRDVGKVVLPLSVPASKSATVAARFLVAGTESPSLAVIELDLSGRPRSHTPSGVEIMDMTGEARASVKSAVELEDRRVLLGTPSYALTSQMAVKGRIYLMQLVDTASGGLEFRITRGGEPGERLNFGLGVAAGKISGGAAQDFVVASATDVVLQEDGNEAMAVVSKCDVSLDPVTPEKYRFRALATADLLAGGGDEIAVGVPREGSTPGKVVILTRAADGLDCTVSFESPEKQAHFGNSILAGDFTGDGKADLLVGAPPTRAYLFAGPFSAGTTPVAQELRHPSLMDSGSTGDFGFRVGAMDADGMPGLEFLVSAPDLPVDGKLGAGQVFVFKRDRMLLTDVKDNSPGADASFGFTLNGLRFAPPAGCGAERNVLLVGSSKEVFTFFRLPNGPADPRCFK
jgi:FG-GAP repeat